LDSEDFFTCTHGRGLRVADYYRCYSEANAELAIAWCKAIKEALPVPKLTGLMHGQTYFFQVYFPQLRGHGATRLLLESPHIDYLHSPPSYTQTKDVHYSMHAIDTTFLHGKLYITQIDAKSHLVPRDSIEAVTEGAQPGDTAETAWETLQIMKRDSSLPLSKNCYMYWLEGGPGTMFPRYPMGYGGAVLWSPLWYDDPSLQRMLAALREISDENRRLRSGSVAETALVVSCESDYYRRPERAFGSLFVEGFRNCVMSRTGVRFDDYLLEDFARITKRYKAYLFLNALHVPAALRRTIREKLAADGATAVWFYAPGYLDETGWGTEKMEELTGIRVARSDGKRFLHVDLLSADHPYLKGFDGPRGFGSDVAPQPWDAPIWRDWAIDRRCYQFSPVFSVADSDATVLGVFSPGGEPGFAVKRVGGSTSVFFGAPLPPYQLIRDILGEAGVHRYSRTGDLVYVNSRYLTLCCRGRGTRTVYLPGSFDVRDALTGQLISRQGRQFELAGEDGEAHIFRLDPPSA
jgi:hypothetical protein